MKLDQIKLYRITHIENIPHILRFGITHKDSQNKNGNYKNIGDLSLIDTRNMRTALIDNGDFNQEEEMVSIVLGDFIPFYFGVRMPMLYVAQHGGNFVENATSPSSIVYLVCSLSSILTLDLDYYFTDGHATDRLTSFYDSTMIDELTSIIDWNAIKSVYWGGNDNLNVKRKKQSEFLFSGDIPSEFIYGYGCYNESAKDNLISLGISENKIKVIPNAYY